MWVQAGRGVEVGLRYSVTEHCTRVIIVESGLAAIEHHLAAFHLSDAARADEITDLRRRVERIERRLDLVEKT